jgi:hypothetical protein
MVKCPPSGGHFLSNKVKHCGYNNMNIVTPNSSTVRFDVRTRPSASYNPFVVKMNYTNEETNVSGSTIVTASYDANDFLQVTASLYASASNFYKFTLVQMSGSVECNQLYRGELFPTTASAYVLDSEPFSSYTSASNTFIIY